MAIYKQGEQIRLASPLGKKTEARRIISIKELLFLMLPPVVMLICLYLHMALPNIYPAGYESYIYPIFLELCIGIYLIFAIIAGFNPKLRAVMRYYVGLLSVGFAFIGMLDLATLKTGRLLLPFIPSPDKIMASLVNNLATVAESFVASMKLLFTGLFFGAVSGFISGILIGWSRVCKYWFDPVLKIIGPVPAAAWLPIVVVLFPTNRAASIFLIALSVWFPLTITLSSAIRNTKKSWIEAARIMGASDWYIMWKVAVPAAMPAVFTGLFMGLSNSFGALIVAEMLGVKAGLGWYINWAQAWGEYARIFSTVIIFAIVFFTLINLLFTLRDHLLKWQKGSVRW